MTRTKNERGLKVMKIRVFSTNEKGKIEFTKDELEKLLNEVYYEGRNDYVTITTPSYPSWTISTFNTSNTTTNPIDGTKTVNYGIDSNQSFTSNTNKIN